MSGIRRRLQAPVLGGLALTAILSGCTTVRMLRHREPDALNRNAFPSRPVRRAATPFQFHRATSLRNDLDTVTVRDTDGRRIPWSEYMEKHAVLAFLVIRNDTILYERYRGGLTDSSIHNSFSVAKSVLSALLGAAIADGSIKSLDQPVTDFVPELRGRSAFNGVTLRNLLDMESGLRFTKADGPLYSQIRSDEAHIYYTTNLVDRIANTPRDMEPGTLWKYKDTDTELLGIAIARATGRSIAAYTEEKLWSRIGTEHDATWSLDRKNGQEKVSSGFNATARDYARFGRLMLERGNWNGLQVLPSDWVTRSTAVDTTRKEPEISSWWQMQHAFYWWHPLQPHTGDFYADGSNGQRVYVDPASKTIIVQLANMSDQDFPFRKLTAYLIGATWNYPRFVPGSLYQAGMRFGVDSIQPIFDRMMHDRERNPESVAITASGMRSAGRLLMDSTKSREAGIRVLLIETARNPHIAAGFVELSDAYLRTGDRVRAAEAIGRAVALEPRNAAIVKKAAALGVHP